MSTNTAVDLKKTTKAELAGQLEKEAAEKAALQQQVDQLLEQNRVILEGVDTAAKNHPVIKSRVALEPMDEQIGRMPSAYLKSVSMAACRPVARARYSSVASSTPSNGFW